MRKLITLIFLLVFSLIKLHGQTPNPPIVGTITQPTCSVTTGSVVLSDLPSSGTWTITRTPGGTTTTGTGNSTTITELPAGSTYTFTVTNIAGYTSTASGNVIINAVPSAPSAPLVSTTSQPTCTVATGSVVLSGLPASGTWTINPGSISGSGTSTTISGIPTGTYNYTVNASGCISPASDNVVINAQPSTPTTPTVGTITQPTCTVATGSVVLSGLPASGTWTINPGSISGSGTSTTISGIATGTYNYTVNASGCTSPASGNVVINAQPTQTAPTIGTITQPTCTVATGSVVLSGLPASGTWTINPGSISGSGTSTTISGIPTGTYNYTVTNASGCISPASDNVVINAQPSTPTTPTVGTITQPTCTVATGSVVLNDLPASGTWTINPGSITGSGTSTTISGIPTGSYNYTVTNASGCISPASGNVVINAQPTQTAPTIGTITQPTCTVATGSVVLNGLPDSGIWTINPGSITGSGISTTISGIATGTYNYTVTNASGCTSPVSGNVVLNTQPTQAAPTIGTITQPICTIATGSVVLNDLPASGTWTLTRNPGGTTTTGTGTSSTISGLEAGTYNYTLTNASGCTSPASANVVINAQPSTPTTPTVGNITQPTCTIATGSVVLSGLPASGTWTINPGSISGSGTSTTISGIATGTYNYTVNASGCTSPASGNVVINAQPTQTAPIIGTITQPTCTVATGSVVLSGLPAFGTWTINPGSISGSGTSTTISGIATGTYSYTVTNASGCTSPASGNVIINTQPTQTAPTIGTITQPTCTVATGSVVLSGLPASGTWTINPGSITGSGTSTTISGITTGTYNYTATNASGCISPVSGNVVINSQPSTPTTPIVGNITQPTCTIATGSVVLSGLPASGTWTINPGSISGSGTSTTISGIATGTYNYTVTNASGCTSQESGNVVINAQPTQTAPTIGTITQPTCTVATGSVVLNGLPASGTWTINPGSITGSGTSTTISGIATGTYNYTVTNASGCISPASGNVVINAQPTQTAPTIGTITQPTCTVATGSVVLRGLPVSGTWTINPGSISGTGTSTTISGIATGTYNYTVTNASGCTSPASGNVVINSQPSTPTTPTVGTITQPTCTIATGSVILSGLPASGTWTLTRNPGGTTTTGTGTSSTISGLEEGTYNYTLTNSSGCMSPASGDVVINAQPTQTAPIIGTITQPTCTVATGSVVLSGLPDSGTWTINPGSITGSGTSTTISDITTGTYNYTVTDASGCTSPVSGNVVINGQPTQAAPTIGTITQPTCTVATGSVVLRGLPVSGTWTINPGSISGSGTSTTISGIATGTYNYTVTNASGCISPASDNVIINAQPSTPTTPTVGTITQPTCTVATGSVVLSGLPASGTWTINPGSISGSGTSTTISGITTGTYNYIVNASGCISPASGDVVINGQPTQTAPTIGTITQPTCTVATGSVVLNDLPASGTWTINPGSISGTGTSTTISGIATGIYSYTVTSASGCISPASGNVVINAQPTQAAPTPGTITQPTCTVATGSVVLNDLPASGTWTLTRNPGGTTTTGTGTSSTISGLGAGTYNYTLTNASGCASPASANVVINAQPSTPTTPTVGNITQPTCTVATGSVVLSGLPASGTWIINPGSITGSGTSTTISGIATGTYNYTVTNALGCTSTVSANVVINAQPTTPTTPAIGTISQPTCTVATGSVLLNGLPSSGTWTLTRNPGGTTTTGTGTSSTISGLGAGTYNYTVTNTSLCTSPASANVVINAQPSTPTAPAIGTITQPTCTVATGRVVLNGLPVGSWTINPGSITGSGTSTTISGIATGTYNYTVNASGCTSPASASVVINTQPTTPTTPITGTISQPTCTVATGSVVLNGLPASGTWTLTRNPGGTTTTGTGTSSTISGLGAETYNFTVTNASGCKSPASANVVIKAQPSTPTAPAVGTITQPTCTVATGSVVLSGLPATGTWTLTRSSNGITTTGTGTSITISGIASGTYTFIVTNASGCSSATSGNVVVNAQPPTPGAPTIGIITQPLLNEITGSVTLNGLPATGIWTITRTPGGTITTGTGSSTTISGITAGTYTFNVTNVSTCKSPASQNVVLYTTKLYGPNDKVLNSNDTVRIDRSDAGLILFRVESDAGWTVSENSLWFRAVKESNNSTIKVNFMENISAVDKVAPIKIKYSSNADVEINIQQKARVSQLKVSKFENIKIYPNPVYDYVYLYFGDDYPEKIRISITTIQGTVLKIRELTYVQANQIIELDVAELGVGQYLIQLSDGKYQKIFHLIKY